MSPPTNTEALQIERAAKSGAREKAQRDLDSVMAQLALKRTDKALRAQLDQLKAEISNYDQDLAIIDAALRAEAARNAEAERAAALAEQAANAAQAKTLSNRLVDFDRKIDAATSALFDLVSARNVLAQQARSLACKVLRPSFPTAEAWIGSIHTLALPEALRLEHVFDKLRMLDSNVPEFPQHLCFCDSASDAARRLGEHLAAALQKTGAVE
jgi:hypothetical protein